ncbi:DUF1956 domain-containing protein [Marinobacter halodurans]|uniref:DUF1956 domain-containing protein n=1 Tax=Marinobacter halodurans TaxID=2528979 RepID=A0ABY1ZNE3_9GAMM|nr:CerR family C-terminal domain-containing protein [Marinobacter halodurans]TBW57973.1 DUF1956 domain-containing protein [Marinobacter halodurans]
MTEPARLEDETAGKLILAGMELFGEHGFKGTTTRMIAEAAHSNIGSIAYYFGNKRGLYLAIARHIAERMRTIFQLPDTPQAPSQLAGLDRNEARRLLEGLVRRMMHVFVREQEARRWLMLVMREQAYPSEAFDILYNEAFEIAHLTITSLIAVLMEQKPTDRRVIIEAHTLVGQIVFFLIGRTPLLRRLDCGDDYPSDLAEMAEQVVLSHVAALQRRP